MGIILSSQGKLDALTRLKRGESFQRIIAGETLCYVQENVEEQMAYFLTF